MNALGGIILAILEFFYSFTKSYGISIIMITIVVELLLLPFNLKQNKEMKKMNELQPKLQELERKYGNDKNKLALERQKLMQESGVSMFAGCLPMLIQLPIVIALFSVLRQHEFNQGFLIIEDLGKVPTGSSVLILAVIMAVTTYVSNKATMAASASASNKNNNMTAMNIMMPLMLGWFTYQVPGGVSLYWIVRNIFTLVKQLIISGPSSIFNTVKRGEMPDEGNNSDWKNRR